MTTYWVEISLANDWANWSANFQETAEALISKGQYERAKNVLPGDILLHHMLGVHCWSGYSVVLKHAEQIHAPQGEWEKAYPYKIQIRPQVSLREPAEFVLTQSVPGLSHNSWHRKSYVRVKPGDAALIKKAIDEARGATGEVDATFLEKLKVLRDTNHSQIRKKNASYCCELCGTTVDSWCEKLGLEISSLRKESADSGWFLHAHHIRHVSKGGDADLENLLCLCPNCHQTVHRLGEDELLALCNRVNHEK